MAVPFLRGHATLSPSRLVFQYSCCGVNGKDDFKKSAWYDAGNKGVPLSCCKLKDPERKNKFNFGNKELVLNDISDPSCPFSPDGRSYATEVSTRAGLGVGVVVVVRDDGGGDDDGNGKALIVEVYTRVVVVSLLVML